MSKHKHYEMIVAKAADMDLVTFYKENGSWFPCAKANKPYLPDFDVMEDYFLCLPQHKEACLHWLNGGETGFEDDDGEWVSCSDWSKKWRQSICGFMQDDNVIRIKPKKVKRVIGVNVKTGQTTSAYELDKEGNYAVDEVRLTKNSAISDWQFIEIEVEE